MVHADKTERGKLAIMLARFGHCVSFADGSEGMELSTDIYDLIIVDEYLSSGAGFIFLQHLSSKIRAKTIFLSRRGREARIICQNSTYECMEKPVKPIDLAVVACDFFVSHLVNEEDPASLSCQGVYFCSGKARAGTWAGVAGVAPRLACLLGFHPLKIKIPKSGVKEFAMLMQTR